MIPFDIQKSVKDQDTSVSKCWIKHSFTLTFNQNVHILLHVFLYLHVVVNRTGRKGLKELLYRYHMDLFESWLDI
uniref:Ovule protein n=1 Tax=Strongyloides venezuelensis TaxID=75913 RepID=A0A0K0FSN8_STRVS